MRQAWEIARDAWRAGGATRPFGELLANYLRGDGYVVSFPDVFILAIPVRFNFGDCVSASDEPDTWLIHLAAATPEFLAKGRHPVSQFLRLAPFRLPFAAWHRHGQGPLRRYSTDRLARFRAATT